MADKNKEYTDRLFNSVKNDIVNLDKRLLIVEGKPKGSLDGCGTIKVEIDLNELYDALLSAVHDCLEQRHERYRAEDAERLEKRRRACEESNQPFWANDDEWRELVYKKFEVFINNVNGYFGEIKKPYTQILDILKIQHKLLTKLQSGQTECSSSVSSPVKETQPSDIPKGFFPRMRFHIRRWLGGSFSFHRGYTIVFAILYSLLFLLTCHFHITIS